MRVKSLGRKQAIDALRTVPLFAECTDKELARIDGLLTEIRVAPGRTLTSRGSTSLQFIIVCDGYARVTSDGEDIGRVGPGSHIGERTVWGENWNAKIVAATPMRVLIMNAGEAAAMFRDVPSLGGRLEREPATPSESPAAGQTGFAHA